MTSPEIEHMIRRIRELSRKLFYPEKDDECSDIDKFRQANTQLARRCDELLAVRGSSDDEEAAICAVLLMGYHAIVYYDEEKIQSVLDRSAAVLPRLASSLLKCKLLIYCYGEIYEKKLAAEARSIMRSWKNRTLTDEEKELTRLLQYFEDNEPRWEYL